MPALTIAAIFLLTSAPPPEKAPVAALVEMLGAKPGKATFDQWKSAWKINYFSKVVLCRPRGYPDAHHGYYEGECRASAAEKHLALLLDTIDRSPENIRALFDQNKALLFAALTPALYESTGAKQTVRALREAYEHAAKTSEQRARLAQVREKVRALLRDPNQKHATYGWMAWAGHYQRAYPDFRASDEINEAWLLSFWARRLSEGNIDVVAAILGGIEAHYSQSGKR